MAFYRASNEVTKWGDKMPAVIDLAFRWASSLTAQGITKFIDAAPWLILSGICLRQLWKAGDRMDSGLKLDSDPSSDVQLKTLRDTNSRAFDALRKRVEAAKQDRSPG